MKTLTFFAFFFWSLYVAFVTEKSIKIKQTSIDYPKIDSILVISVPPDSIFVENDSIATDATKQIQDSLKQKPDSEIKVVGNAQIDDFTDDFKVTFEQLQTPVILNLNTTHNFEKNIELKSYLSLTEHYLISKKKSKLQLKLSGLYSIEQLRYFNNYVSFVRTNYNFDNSQLRIVITKNSETPTLRATIKYE